MKSRVLPMLSALALTLSVLAPVSAHDGEHDEGKQETGWPGSAKAQEVARAMLADAQPAADLAAESATTCTGESAAGYPCSNVDLLSFLPLADIGGGKGNDIWGWTDAATGREYAIMGRTNGTAFVDISVPTQPIYLGNLPTTRFASTWRDVKVHANHAYIVSEARQHGMQVFDLTRLRNVTNPPVTFSTDARYTGFATAHNLFINEDSGFAYVVGSNTCSGGLHIVDVRSPKNPVQAGCYSGDGYTHDVQCVTYTGPDTSRTGRELCFASNEDTLTIIDATDKAAPVMLAQLSYPGVAYTHQGWLTEDQRYFLIDDELDEGKGFNTRTYVFDVANPAAPVHIGTHVGTNPAIDHNQYIVGNHTFQANYRSGLRILRLDDLATAKLSEVAFFDVYPADDHPEFNGAWSVYPFFASGTVIVSGIEQGLYVLRPNLGPANDPPAVAITQPGNGEKVSGSVLVNATASDDNAVTQVEFFVDGSSIGLASSGADGWSITWDTTQTDNGSRTLTATATDTAGQTSSHSIGVTVDNLNSPPTASFTQECVNLTCDFDGNSSTDGDGTIVSYAWDFGDLSTGSGSTVSHTFATGGDYTVVLTVTDNDGTSTQHSEVVTIDGPTATMHVGNLDGRFELKGKSGRWEAFVTVTVHDGFENPVDGAMVSAEWSGEFSGSATGTTGSDGRVVFSTGTMSGGTSVTFTVNGITHATLTYAAGDNHDPDGDSDGTTVTVSKN